MTPSTGPRNRHARGCGQRIMLRQYTHWSRHIGATVAANGRVIRDGSDPHRLGRAEKIMKLAAAFGVEPAL